MGYSSVFFLFVLMFISILGSSYKAKGRAAKGKGGGAAADPAPAAAPAAAAAAKKEEIPICLDRQFGTGVKLVLIGQDVGAD